MWGRPVFELNTEPLPGCYVCTRCGLPLFAATHKFEAGCGFPSFWERLPEGVELKSLNTYGRHRVQLLCANCGLHLGHQFSHPQTPTRLRYCINGEAIRYQSDG